MTAHDDKLEVLRNTLRKTIGEGRGGMTDLQGIANNYNIAHNQPLVHYEATDEWHQYIIIAYTLNKKEGGDDGIL